MNHLSMVRTQLKLTKLETNKKMGIHCQPISLKQHLTAIINQLLYIYDFQSEGKEKLKTNNNTRMKFPFNEIHLLGKEHLQPYHISAIM